MGRNMA
jgi:hypothetical protein